MILIIKPERLPELIRALDGPLSVSDGASGSNRHDLNIQTFPPRTVGGDWVLTLWLTDAQEARLSRSIGREELQAKWGCR